MLDVDITGTKEKRRRDVAVAARVATKTTSLHCVRPGVFNMIQPDVSDEDAAGIEREMRRLAEQQEEEEQEEEQEEGAKIKVFRMHGCRGMSVRGMHAITRGLQKHLSTLEVLSMWECQLDEVGGGLRIGELLLNSDTLKELDLTCGGITSTGAAAIGRAMATNTSLEKLRLTGNRIAAVNAGGGAACVVHKGIASIAGAPLPFVHFAPEEIARVATPFPLMMPLRWHFLLSYMIMEANSSLFVRGIPVNWASRMPALRHPFSIDSRAFEWLPPEPLPGASSCPRWPRE